MATIDKTRFWWADDGFRPLHEKVFEHVRALETEQEWVHEQNLPNAKLYSNCEILGLDWNVDVRKHGRRFLGGTNENVIQSVIDTATSMIAKNRPKATFVTDDGDFTEQRKAMKLDKYVFAEFLASGVYKECPRAFRDACIFGTGVVKVLGEDGRLKVERVIPDEIIVDEREALSSAPRQMHRSRPSW